MRNAKKITAEDALEAHMERFGFIPWGLSTMDDDHIVAAVEKALKDGEPYKDEVPEDCVL